MEKVNNDMFSIRINQHKQNSYKNEQELWLKNKLVCGVDEVGRGCLAGPIVTAAVILHYKAIHPGLIDSKKNNPFRPNKNFQMDNK